ncbi:MAG: hypothetical protein Gaeavirus35_2 [Gaeavirus sp.]|uniref:Uncharacterized protein n=1 Tax=Gaeavirus sp. TaxID=2487767 RepID=A0A3G4ZZL6_9VIRU|nr:MAG: hypothetical protein Gaeavirus35_2 [Gaeavirus sp.]
MTHIEDTYNYDRQYDINISEIHLDHRINPTVIRMYIGFYVPPMKYILQHMDSKPLICFGSCEGIDFTKYDFTNYIEEIYTDRSIECTLVDFTCFKNLLLFSSSYEPSISITSLMLPSSLRTLHINGNQSLIGMNLPINLQEISFSYNFDEHLLANIKFPVNLRHINFGIINKFINIVFPEEIEHITIYAKVIERKLIPFPPTLKKLTIHNSSVSLNDLPNSIEELNIMSVEQDVTNLPPSLQKIIVRRMPDDKIIKIRIETSKKF